MLGPGARDGVPYAVDRSVVYPRRQRHAPCSAGRRPIRSSLLAAGLGLGAGMREWQPARERDARPALQCGHGAGDARVRAGRGERGPAGRHRACRTGRPRSPRRARRRQRAAAAGGVDARLQTGADHLPARPQVFTRNFRTGTRPAASPLPHLPDARRAHDAHGLAWATGRSVHWSAAVCTRIPLERRHTRPPRSIRRVVARRRRTPRVAPAPDAARAPAPGAREGARRPQRALAADLHQLENLPARIVGELHDVDAMRADRPDASLAPDRLGAVGRVDACSSASARTPRSSPSPRPRRRGCRPEERRSAPCRPTSSARTETSASHSRARWRPWMPTSPQCGPGSCGSRAPAP